METVVFTDQKTQEQIEFTVEEETTLNGVRYLLVSEAAREPEEEAASAYLLKEVGAENEETVYQMVEDEVEFTALAKVFAELIDEDTALEY